MDREYTEVRSVLLQISRLEDLIDCPIAAYARPRECSFAVEARRSRDVALFDAPFGDIGGDVVVGRSLLVRDVQVGLVAELKGQKGRAQLGLRNRCRLDSIGIRLVKVDTDQEDDQLS